MTMAEKKKPEKQVFQEPDSFEAGMRELESIVTQMDQDQVTLENAVALYERGLYLQNFCQKCLDQARLKIEKVTLETSGEQRGEPFEAP